MHRDVANRTCTVGTAINAIGNQTASHSNIDCLHSIAIAVSTTEDFTFHSAAQDVYIGNLFYIACVATAIDVTATFAGNLSIVGNNYIRVVDTGFLTVLSSSGAKHLSAYGLVYSLDIWAAYKCITTHINIGVAI